jgi:uncharacterized membrane protein YphA (DoxX/SURF4 family)
VKRRVLTTLLRVALGAIFLMAALPKLRDPEAFALSISNYRMLPVFAERVLALVLPPLEALVGVCLILGVLDAGASAIVLALMVIFTAAVGSALARGLDISCGCFDTKAGEKIALGKLAENLALTSAALAVAVLDRSWCSVRGWMSRTGDIE